jgi:hypothetical protein
MMKSPLSQGTQTALMSAGNAGTRLVILSAALLLQSGCGVSLPTWLRPGHLYQQRLRATHFDPYADVDAAPEITGGRPRDYVRPRAQAEKAQWFLDSAGQ